MSRINLVLCRRYDVASLCIRRRACERESSGKADPLHRPTFTVAALRSMIRVYSVPACLMGPHPSRFDLGFRLGYSRQDRTGRLESANYDQLCLRLFPPAWIRYPDEIDS